MSSRQKFILISTALFGLCIPNGMFFIYIFFRFHALSEVVNDLLALGFIIDAFMAMGFLAWWFAQHPIGRYSWKMFIVLSLVGGLGFSLPLFYYLNNRLRHS